MADHSRTRITRDTLLKMKHGGRKFAMLTAYDYPTARLAQRAGVHVLLTGDSLGCVILGHENTRNVPIDLIVTLTEAVRRGAPDLYLMGDMPFAATSQGAAAVLKTARRFRDEAGCDGVKIEVSGDQGALIEQVAREGIETIAHLGLRPQTVVDPADYRAQARDEAGVQELAAGARRMVDAGAAMLLLEAVPGEAAQAVVDAVEVPVIGCGAGPACDGHVVVTHDMLGLSDIRPPRFVPVLGQIGAEIEKTMRKYVRDIGTGDYPAAQHVYGMKKPVHA